MAVSLLLHGSPNVTVYRELRRIPKGKAILTRLFNNVHNVITDTNLKTRLIEWTRQLRGKADKIGAKASTNVGVADLSWSSGN
ncbi:hypothetical protein [Pseudoalteromonas sp. TB64]|uniref:hypothetical protein n=1 Tax=Pseudoalteromonas sp. TB64 TaxID=1938600 RepID=UPI0003F5CD0B|nr:hypothetical protein [Pseudoalteromonas sp. TB64]